MGLDMGLGWGEKLNLYGGEETIHAIDMEDLEGNVNRAGAEKSFKLYFLFLIHCFHYPRKIRSRILTTQLLTL